MSQNPIIDSGTQSSKTSGLKPALATALGSLEVQLDQELTRYRRARNGVRQPKKVSTEREISSQPQQLNTMTGELGKTQLSVTEVQTNVISPEHPTIETEDQEQINHTQLSSAPESTKTTTLPAVASKSMSSIVPTKTKTAEAETLVATNNTPSHPDDYLESSEALLRSLQKEQPQTKKLTGSNDSLVSPLGIGSMLLLLLASLTLGYVVYNPQTLPQLNLAKLFNRGSLSDSENTVVSGNTTVAESNPSPIAPTEITSIPKYPNLAAREFPQVKDPNDVVGLKPKVKPTLTAIPKPITIETPINPVVPPVLAIPKPKETLSGLNADIKPSADGLYYLVADNQGDGALATARKVVPDAYLSEGQKYIYLGVSKTKEEVKQKLQMLETKGIKARVRQP